MAYTQKIWKFYTCDTDLSFILDQYIGNMVKANVVLGMQKYLGDALVKCNTSRKIGNTPISVSTFTSICA